MIISLLPFLKVHLQTLPVQIPSALQSTELFLINPWGQWAPWARAVQSWYPTAFPARAVMCSDSRDPPGCRHICFFVGLFQLSAFYQQSRWDKLVRSPFSLVSPYARVVQFSAGMVSRQSGLRFILVIECTAFRPAESTYNPALTPAIQWNTRHKCVLSLWMKSVSCPLLINCFFSNFVKAQGWTLYMWLYL